MNDSHGGLFQGQEDSWTTAPSSKRPKFHKRRNPRTARAVMFRHQKQPTEGSSRVGGKETDGDQIKKY